MNFLKTCQNQVRSYCETENFKDQPEKSAP